MACEPGTGWFYCGWHATDGLLVCRWDCTCLDQGHCTRLASAPSDAEGATYLPVVLTSSQQAAEPPVSRPFPPARSPPAVPPPPDKQATPTPLL